MVPAAVKTLAQAIYEARFPNAGTRFGERAWSEQPAAVQAVWENCAKAAILAYLEAAKVDGGAVAAVLTVDLKRSQEATHEEREILIHNTAIEKCKAVVRAALIGDETGYDERKAAYSALDALAAKPSQATPPVDALVEALEKIRGEADAYQDGYHKNGPSWTGKSGHEYEDASYVLEKTQTIIEIVDTALATAKAVDTKRAPAKPDGIEGLCGDCPPVGYPTDETRCDPCPRHASIPSEDTKRAEEPGPDFAPWSHEAWSAFHRAYKQHTNEQEGWVAAMQAACAIDRPEPVKAVPVSGEVPADCPHMIVFEDDEEATLTFAGHGAREAALKKWEQISDNWNAHLFVRVESNVRDEHPNATIAHPSPDALRDEVKAQKAIGEALSKIEKEIAQRVDSQNDHLYEIHETLMRAYVPARSFPSAADGSELPEGAAELFAAGLAPDDARFVAGQLARDGFQIARLSDGARLWHSVQPINRSSIVGGGAMLLAESGECIGLVHVLNVAPEKRSEIEAAVSAALSRPATRGEA